MKIKAGEVSGIIQAINETAEARLPFKLSYWLARTAKELLPAQEVFEAKRRDLISDHAEKDEAGKVVPVGSPVAEFVEVLKDRAGMTDEEAAEFVEGVKVAGEPQVKIVDPDAFQEAFTALADEEVDVKMDPLSPETLQALEEGDVEITPATIFKLLPLTEQEAD